MAASTLQHQESNSKGPADGAFEFPFNDSGGRDTIALESYEQAHPLRVGMIRYHRFDHEGSCRIYRVKTCDCAVVMWVIDVPVSQLEAAQDFLPRVFGRAR
jgi:hypothetical protein